MCPIHLPTPEPPATRAARLALGLAAARRRIAELEQQIGDDAEHIAELEQHIAELERRIATNRPD